MARVRVISVLTVFVLLILNPVETMVRAKLPSGSARASPPARHASRPRPSGRVPRPLASPERMGSTRDLNEKSNSNETIKTLMISLETGAKPRDWLSRRALH